MAGKTPSSSYNADPRNAPLMLYSENALTPFVKGQARRRRHLLMVLLVLPALPAISYAEDWNYHVRPTDNIWDIASRYLKPGIPWQRLQEYNKVSAPLRLMPGSVLHVPVLWLKLEPAEATVIGALGDSTVRSGDDAAQAVVVGMKVGFGTRLTTGPQASLTVQLADGSRVLVQASSELLLDRLSSYGSTGMVDTRLHLLHGRIASDVTPLKGNLSRFIVTTPDTSSSVRGTHFRVVSDRQNGQDRTEVVGGRVDVSGRTRHVPVGAGLGIVTNSGKAPGTPEPLPARPTIHCPTAPVDTMSFEITWDAADDIHRFRVQAATDEKFEALLMDKVVDGASTDVRGLDDGHNAIRVRSIAPSGLEGEDATCTIEITAKPLPPIIVGPQASVKIREPRPEFRWMRSDIASSYRWQLGTDDTFSGAPSEEMEVKGDHVRPSSPLATGRYYWRVATRDREGRLGPYSQPLPVERVEESAAPAVASRASRQAGLQLSWPRGSSAGQRYHVQLARRPDFTTPAVDTVTNDPILSVTRPRAGTWYARVQVIESDGYVGPWGAVQETRVGCAACTWAAAAGGATLLWLLVF